MDEFLNLILTGGRLQEIKRNNNLFIAFSLAEMLCGVTLLFTATPDVNVAVSAVFGALLILFGVLNAVLMFRRSLLSETLVKEQIFAEQNSTDEAGKARASLGEKYSALESGKVRAVNAFFELVPLAFYLSASVLSILINLEITGISYIVPALYILAVFCTVIFTLFPAIKGGKIRTQLYETADAEITILKKNAGYAETTIAKQSYNARNSATRSQELFLCDPADRRDLRRLFSVMGYCALALIVVLVSGVSALGLMSASFDGKFMAVSSVCLLVAVISAWVAVAVYIEIRRRAIYRRNEAKFSDSEADGMRKYLQNEFIKLQRAGNIFFPLFCGIPTVTGFILGAIGAVNDPELSFIENASGMAGVFFFISAVVSFIIWTIIYVFYRKKVKPVEIRLSSMSENYGKTN